MTSRSDQESGFTRRNFLKGMGAAVAVALVPDITKAQEKREIRRSIMIFFEISPQGKKSTYVAYKFPLGQSWTETYAEAILTQLGPDARRVKSSPTGETIQVHKVEVEVDETRVDPNVYNNKSANERNRDIVTDTAQTTVNRGIGAVAGRVSRGSSALGDVVIGVGQILNAEIRKQSRSKNIEDGLENATAERTLVTISLEGGETLTLDCSYDYNSSGIINLQIREVTTGLGAKNKANKREPVVIWLGTIDMAGKGLDQKLRYDVLVNEAIRAFGEKNKLPI